MLVDAASTETQSRPASDSATAVKVPAARVPLIARFLPSLTDIAFLMPLIFLFGKLQGARTLLGDGDTGWHVRTGEWILAHHQVPHQDIFSFSRPGAPWLAWEWLWDVLFAMLHQRWGMAAVVLASIFVICLTSTLLFRLIRRKCDNGLVAIAVTLLAAGGCSIHWLARPHLFTILFLTIALHITDRAAEGRIKLLAWLIPLTLVWTNLHGGFFVVFLVLACYIGSDLLNAAIESDTDRRREFLRRLQPWGATFAACFAVTFINPYGWQLHKHIVQYITDPYQLMHISEFQAMNFHSPVVVYFEPLMVLAVVAAFRDARRRRFADVFLSLGWLHLALIAQRNLPLFAIAASPSVARCIVALVRSMSASRTGTLSPEAWSPATWIGHAARWFQQSTASIDQTDRIGRFYLVALLPLALIGAVLIATPQAGVMESKFTSTYDPNLFPEKALSLLREADTHHIFAQDQWEGRNISFTAKIGMMYRSLPAPTTRPSMMASVSGSLSVNVVPWPGRDAMSMRPRSFAICLRATSMPTPRPETLVTCSAVENPGSKIKLNTS